MIWTVLHVTCHSDVIKKHSLSKKYQFVLYIVLSKRWSIAHNIFIDWSLIFSLKKNLEILPPRVWPEKLDWKKSEEKSKLADWAWANRQISDVLIGCRPIEQKLKIENIKLVQSKIKLIISKQFRTFQVICKNKNIFYRFKNAQIAILASRWVTFLSQCNRFTEIDFFGMLHF